jgi:hypothetical protein
VPFYFRLGTLETFTRAAFLTLLCLFGMAGSLHAIQIPTDTAITITVNGTFAGSVSSGTVVLLTANVTQPSMEHPKVTLGTVNFCDATATYCEDSHLIGSAQLTSNGTATIKFRPAPGQHSYEAVFHGTTGFAPSASFAETLAVTGGPFATTTTIAQSGSAGNYTLTGTVTSSGNTALAPTGTIDFNDVTNGGYLLGNVAVTPGPATASYAPFVSYSSASAYTEVVAVADLNGDGIPDLILGNNPNSGASPNLIAVLLGKGDGTYQSPVTYSNIYSSESIDAAGGIVVGDLNGDGWPDVVVMGADQYAVYVFMNDGKGDGGLNDPNIYTFNNAGNYGPGPMGNPGGIAIGDVNNDGKLDVVLTFPQDSINGTNCSSYGEGGACAPLAVMLGNGDGTLQMGNTSNSPPWTPEYSSGFPGGGEFTINPLVLTDMRGNGMLDAVVTFEEHAQVCVVPGNGDGTFGNPNCYPSDASGVNIVTGDFRGDGHPDVAAVISGGTGVSILLGNGDDTLQGAIDYGNMNGPNHAIASDINGDGKLDLVTVNENGGVAALLGNGDGTFQSGPTASAVGSGLYSSNIVAADLNGDGVMDLAVGNWSASEVNVLLGSVTSTATAQLNGVSVVGPASATHSVQAGYGGDDYFTDSSSASTSLTPQPVPTTLALGANTSTVTVGGTVTLTATVTPASAQSYTPSGTVTFYSNGVSIGTASVSNGVAVLMPHLNVVQTDSITASYAGNSNFIGSSTSLAVSVTVQQSATTLTLQICNYTTTWVCPATTSSYGGEIMVTATLSPSSVNGGGNSDGETITFYNNGTVYSTATLGGGAATLNLDQIPAGSYSFTASYLGDTSFIASSTTSASLMTVAKVTPSMTLGVSPTGTNTYGQPVYLTATFNTYPYNVAGETVSFYNGANVVGTATFGSGSAPAMLTLNNLPVGSYSFSAKYSGDSNWNSTTASPSSLTVQKLPTLLTINSGAGTLNYGSPVTLQIQLGPYNVSGGNTTNSETISVYDNGAFLGNATLTNGVAMYTVNVPPVGTDSFTASYAGDTSFGASSTTQADVITVQPASTTMGITTSAPHGYIGSGLPFTLIATILPYNEAGGASTNGDLVTFYQNGTSVGTGTLSNGSATYPYPGGLPKGNYTFSASFSGDASFSGSSTSPNASLIVLQATTLTLATSPANFAALNQPITITAALSPYISGSDNTNNQYVALYDGTSAIGNQPLVNGVVTFSYPSGLSQGSYSLTAVYDGDGVLAGSTSAPVTFSVATIQNFVVNVDTDDAGTASNCTPQSSTTSNATDRACSLRDALLAAASSPEGAKITFDVNFFRGPDTITLTNGTLTVPSNTSLTGPTLYGGANRLNLVTVNGNGTSINQASSTVFTVTGTATAISNLIVTGGWTPWNNGSPPSGGGIANSGSLTLTNSTITGNGTIASGGGIYNTGTLTVVGSTIADNSAADDGFGDGGGIDNDGNGTLAVINSTLANNSVGSGYGGGIAVVSGTATITNSTISGNTVGGGGGGISTVNTNSSGVTTGGGTATLANTIVSGNNDFLSDIDDGGVAYTDKGGNIVGFLNRTSPAVNDPNLLNLSPLGNYGGPTQTMLPLPGSSAICAGTIGNSPSQWQPQSIQIDIDERGYPNYNIQYSQLRYANGGSPLPSVCFDSGAVQTNYTVAQFLQSSYSGIAGGVVTPTVTVAVGENGANRGAVPVTLNYSGPGNLNGNLATTVEDAGAEFPTLSADTIGSGTLSTKIVVAGSSYISASASLNVLVPVQILPGSETISVAAGAPLSQPFNVSGGSGSYQLTSSGTLPIGLILTPTGTSTGSSWMLSGTPTQAGSFNFTLTATDATDSAVTSSQNYVITVAPATTTTLATLPASSAPFGQTVTLTATVSSPTATGTVAFFDGTNSLGSAAVSGGSPNTATLALNASTLGSSLAYGAHSFTAQYSGDANNAASTSSALAYNVTPPNLVVNTTSDDNGSFTCTALASTTSNITDGNNGGNPGLCTLRDALNTASGLGAGGIYFDTTVFAASNLAGNPTANTIAVNSAANGSLNLPPNTTIQGLTSGSGATLANLVTVDGGGSGVANNGTIFFTSSTNVAINNLNINNGYASNGGNGGAITNFGSITVTGSTFTGNQATTAGGGIYNAGGTLTIVNSTFSSNVSAGGFGGAIDNSGDYGCGAITVTNSTFSQNSSTNGGLGRGGAISNDPGGCVLTVFSTTMDGNTTDNLSEGSGAGIYNISNLYMANSVITDNINGASNEDDVMDYSGGSNFFDGSSVVNGNLIGVFAGTPQNGINVGLAPAGNYGGPGQTIIPLPGSSAICAGLASNIPSGVTTDERGDPLQPAGGYCPSGTVDAGSAQTNYAISFTTQPPTNVAVNAALSPAPVVTLTESGSAFIAANTGAVNMTDSAGLLSGTASEAFSAGAANFNNLIITGTASDDILIATIPLNGAINLTALATTGISASLTNTLSPSSGTLSASQTFSWSNGAGSMSFVLLLGTTGAGSSDLYSSGITKATSATVAIPSDGVMVYATLKQYISVAWQQSHYTFTEPGTTTPATLTPSSGVLSTGQTFTWNNGAGPVNFFLTLGTTGAGTSDLYSSGITKATSAIVSIPTNGVTVFATFRQLVNGTWQVSNYTFTESGSPTPATLTPSTGALSSSQAFTWNNGAGPLDFTLLLGTAGAGSSDLYNSGVTKATSTTVAIPSNGLTVFATLKQFINGAWQQSHYTFTEVGSPTLATLTPSSGVLSTSQTFTWNNGAGPVNFFLTLGTTGAGSSDLYSSGITKATSATVSIPPNNVRVYATFRQLINGTWQVEKYTFTESPRLATLSPSTGTLSGVQTFTWNNGAGATDYELLLGTTGQGTSDIYSSGVTRATSETVSISTNGVKVYATLKQFISGTWQASHYTFIEP